LTDLARKRLRDRRPIAVEMLGQECFELSITFRQPLEALG
jgi:hypothetical protein